MKMILTIGEYVNRLIAECGLAYFLLTLCFISLEVSYLIEHFENKQKKKERG